jgi:hypothetical protein
MADVHLWLRDVFEGNVPPLCVCCGAPATTWKNYTALTGCGGLPVFLLAAIFADVGEHAGRIWLCLPFCHRHRHHWLWRRLIVLARFAAVIFLPIVALELMNEDSQNAVTWAGPLIPGACGLSLVAPLAWLAAYCICRRTGVRVVGHDKEAVAISGVCQLFVDAVGTHSSSTTRDLRNSGRDGRPFATDPDQHIQE